MARESSQQAIQLTPAGSAALAVVRLRGPAVGRFLRDHFSRPAAVGHAVHGRLSDGERVIDDPVVVAVSEDVADLSLHGGPWIVRSVLDLAARESFEVIERPGLPLADEAVEGDTLLDREIASHLPMARTELALLALLGQREAWRQLQARVGAGITAAEIRQIQDDRSLWWLLHPPRVALVGAPNVGKSTLANQLFAQERSIAADVPGTTRDWVGAVANLDGLAVTLVDTPGLREPTDSIERVALERSGGQIRQADLVVLVLDVTRPLAGEQQPLIERYPQALRLVNKCDRRRAWDPQRVGGLCTAATTGVGLDALRTAIRARFGCESAEVGRPCCWTERQQCIVRRAIDDPGLLANV